MGGGGMEVEVEVDLSRGAVAAMWRHHEGMRPVLQLADAPRPLGEPAPQRHLVALSDGAHLQLGVLATTLAHLVATGALRRGSVVRVLEYYSGPIQNRRVVVVIQLEILQAECSLIGNPTSYEANVTQHIGVSSSGNLGSYETCSRFTLGNQPVVSNSSSLAGHGLLDSSIIPRTVPMPAQNTVDAKMQQLSLNDHGNQMFKVTATGDAFGPSSNTYGSPMPPSCLRSTQMYMDRSHVARNESSLCITPINALSPYQVRWMIKARVTAKTDLRHFTNPRGTGKVFTFDLLDAQGGEVRATCFNLQADHYFDLIEVDKVYLISQGSLKPALKNFNPLNNDFEILVDHTSSIEICCGDENSIPRQRYNFIQISEIGNTEAGALVDLVGIVTSVGPSVMLMRTDGTEAQKRSLQLKDMSGRSVEINLWGKFCDAEGQQLQLLCDSGSNPTLALKAGRVSAFFGKSVATISSTQLEVDPGFPEAERLRQWYMAGGKTAPCISLSQDVSSMSTAYVQKTIAQIKGEGLGRSAKPDLITVRAVISYVKADSFCYPACIMEVDGKRCYKKVTDNGDGTWSCDRCKQCSENCEYRYVLVCQIKDDTGTAFATAFQEAGEVIVGHTARELFMARSVEQDDARFTKIMEAVVGHEYIFKLRLKEETYHGEQRVKCYIVGAEKSDNHHALEGTGILLKDSTPSTAPPQSIVSSAGLEAGAVKDGTGLCFRCNQPGHWAANCPVQAT
ncbi:hypothetical protein U9M48_041541 [Paspalum notatum var. saurae]|uniref:Replication protein A subunit n=1 Tax=Paspalum notatum var. saurae TaxID=547442 RepID=A0AAQ3USV6_PASNO